MRLVERHVIKRSDPRFAVIDRAAFASKNLYSAANYELRQSFIFRGVSLSYPEMHRRMKGHEAYRALPAKVARQVLRTLDQNWQSFFAALAAWREDPSRFLGRPRLPRYKDKQQGRTLLVYTLQALSIPALRNHMVCPSMLGITAQTRQQNVQQVRIIPRIGFYVAEVVGIQVRITEESYTSKASFLDADPLLAYDARRLEPPAFSGRRVKRGLYRAADGRPINADANGSYNVIRKGAPEAFARGNRGCVVHPIRLAV